MEPTTMIAVASFAMSLFKKSGPNPMDAVVEMLKNINSKLNLISENLADIRKSISEIPDRNDYVTRINNIKGITRQVENIYRDYKSDIQQLGKVRGKRKFINENKPEIERKLEKLQENFNILRDYNDPLTVNLVCLCSQIDYELSNLIDIDKDYIKHQQQEYFQYLKANIFNDPNSIEIQVKNETEKLKSFLFYEHLEIRNHIYRKEEHYSRGRGDNRDDWYEWEIKSNTNSYHLWTPIFLKKELETEEQLIFNILYELGYNQDKNYYVFEKFQSRNLTISSEINNAKNLDDKCGSTHVTDKNMFGKKKRYWTKRCNNLNKNKFTDALPKQYDRYILTCLSHKNAIELLKKLILISN